MRATEVTCYVKLIVEDELSREDIHCWNDCVRAAAPEGVVSRITVDSPDGDQGVALVHRICKDVHEYIIPLHRNLAENEANRIVARYSNANADKDFDIEATLVPTGRAAPPPALNLDQERYLDFCVGLAKKQHEDWLSRRQEDGWRFGAEVSSVEKTHPLLRPWEELPEEYRYVDMKQPQRLLDLLDEHGYSVVKKPDLEKVIRALRREAARKA
jgi:hypothetical protein